MAAADVGVAGAPAGASATAGLASMAVGVAAAGGAAAAAMGVAGAAGVPTLRPATPLARPSASAPACTQKRAALWTQGA